MRVSAQRDSVELGVSGHGGEPATASTSSNRWVRELVTFETGPKSTQATIHLRKTSDGDRHAWCDNRTLPLLPPKPDE
jgi:hypothetical protein